MSDRTLKDLLLANAGDKATAERAEDFGCALPKLAQRVAKPVWE